MAARIDQVLGPGRTDQPRQALRSSGTGDDPQLDLGLADPRVLGREAEVRAQGQLAAPAQGVAVDGGDGDLRDLLDLVEGLLEAGDHGLGLLGRHLDHHVHVGPGREDALPAPDHDRADVVTIARLARGLHQVSGQLVVDRVHLGPVQADGPDAVLDLEPDELSHAILL